MEIGLNYADYIDLSEVEEGFRALTESSHLSFRDLVEGFLSGTIPFDLNQLPTQIADLFFGELLQQRKVVLQILIIVLVSAICSNFIRIFENNQIADISYYMMYLLVAALLVNSFADMNQMVMETCSGLSDFMKLLLPPYLITIVLSAGSISAIGFYEITVLTMNLLQILIMKLILPAINIYLVLLMLNQMAKEDYFSHLAELLEMCIGWMLKTMLGLVIGLQTVQGLVSPAVDSLKNSALHRMARMIPGAGNVLDSAAETVAGAAAVIKNSVGAAGMTALVFLCALPLLKLLACTFLFRLLCALIQPISEKRMLNGIESVARGTALLLRVQLTALAVFLISIALITAAVRGG